MELQQKGLEQQQNKVEALLESVTLAKSKMQPFIKLETLVAFATSGYTWLSFMLYTIVLFNMVWIATHLTLAYLIHPYMFCMIVLMALTKLFLMYLNSKGIVSQDKCVEYVEFVWLTLLVLQFILYTFGLIWGLFKKSACDTASIQYMWDSASSISQGISPKEQQFVASYSPMAWNNSPQTCHTIPCPTESLYYSSASKKLMLVD